MTGNRKAGIPVVVADENGKATVVFFSTAGNAYTSRGTVREMISKAAGCWLASRPGVTEDGLCRASDIARRIPQWAFERFGLRRERVETFPFPGLVVFMYDEVLSAAGTGGNAGSGAAAEPSSRTPVGSPSGGDAVGRWLSGMGCGFLKEGQMDEYSEGQLLWAAEHGLSLADWDNWQRAQAVLGTVLPFGNASGNGG